MSDSTIEWTQKVWNPVLGCSRVSAGCTNCYAITSARIRQSNPNPKIATAFAGLVERVDDGSDKGRLDWTGQVNLLPERLFQPLRWKAGQRVFVNSMSDLFHKNVPRNYIVQVFAVMALARWHQFQLLTKQPARMRSLLNDPEFRPDVHMAMQDLLRRSDVPIPIGNKRALTTDVEAWMPYTEWPLPNLWLGVSVENQKWADIRIPALLATPAAVRWLSCEPLLGPLNLFGSVDEGCDTAGPAISHEGYSFPVDYGSGTEWTCDHQVGIDWVVAGGESGHNARPMHPDWARSLRDQCQAAGVPFLFKQWGEWGPAEWKVERIAGEADHAYKDRAEAVGATHVHTHNPIEVDGETTYHLYKPNYMPWSIERQPMGEHNWHAPIRRWGKKKAGRELDGLVHDGYPAAGRA
jgi:protein gp37